MEKLRFHLDENMDRAIARAVRLAGIDITTTVDAELRSTDDHIQLEYARVNRRVLVTDDADFLRLAKDGIPHAGIVYSLRRFRTVGDIVRELIRLHRLYVQADVENRVMFVSPQPPRSRT